MTVKELRDCLNALPECYDNLPVVSFQAEVETYFNGSSDEVRFTGFNDIELKKVKADLNCLRIN